MKNELWRNSAIVILVWCLYVLLRSSETVTDTLMASMLLPNIALGHGIDMSQANLGIDLAKEQSKYYLWRPPWGLVGIYPIGMSLLAAPIQGPLWILAWLFGFDISVMGEGFSSTRFLLEKLSAAFLTALSVLVVYKTLVTFLKLELALWLATVYAFGSGAVCLLSQGLWQSTGINLVCVSLLYVLLKDSDRCGRREEVLFFAGVGFLFALRPTAVVWSAAFAWAFRRRYGKISWAAITACLLGALPALVWNIAIFQNPLGGYIGVEVPTFDITIDQCFRRLSLILFSHERGLVVFDPLMVVGLLSISACLSLDTRKRVVMMSMLSAECGYLLLCSTNPSWHAGRCFGPRYMLDGLGVAFALFGVVVSCSTRTYPRLTAWFVVLVGMYSIALNTFGAIGADVSSPVLRGMHHRILLPEYLEVE